MTTNEKRFQTALIAGLCFFGCTITMSANGWVIAAGIFGIIAAVCIACAIFHVGITIWEEEK